MNKTEKRRVRTTADTEIEYTLERKNVKNINLRVNSEGRAMVSAPSGVRAEFIDGFVRENAGFVLKATKKIREIRESSPCPISFTEGEQITVFGEKYTVKIIREKPEGAKILERDFIISVAVRDSAEKRAKLAYIYTDELLTEAIAAFMNKYYPVFKKMGATFPEMHLKTMKTRWGSCLKQKARISMNRALYEKPTPCIEYVTLHEMCHLIHADHSPRFYGLLTSLMPDWKERRAELNGKK